MTFITQVKRTSPRTYKPNRERTSSLSLKLTAAMSHFSLFIFSLLSLLPSSHPQVTLPLGRLPLPSHSDELGRLADAAAASVLRAASIRSPAAHRTALFSHSYGGYSISLDLGTPPQTLTLLVDTGSSLTWIPCTASYRCTRCSSPSNSNPSIPKFLPKSSSSARLIGCRNPKCDWIHPQEEGVRSDCGSQICPPYVVMYGLGSTGGLLLSETLELPGLTVENFTVGCSVFSDRQPAGGIAGFGPEASSLPSQLRLPRFSYCLVSRRFDDDASTSGSLILGGDKHSPVDAGVRFTPILKTPNSDLYYYVSLRKITIGGIKVKIPYSSLAGGGGVIVDSGTTFTYMESAAFEPVVLAFSNQVATRYNRSAAAEAASGLRPCFDVPATPVTMPEMVLHFKGGAEMNLPLENYFAFAGSAVCLTVVSDGGLASEYSSDGPSVIIGSFQQQNYLMVYDLEKGRLGFRQQSCVGA